MPYTPLLAGQMATPGALGDGLVELVMDWTPIDDIGNFGTNFSAGSPMPRMRKLSVLGTELWEFEGRISASAFAAATTLTAFTFDVGYRVSAERGFSCYGAGSIHYPIRAGFQTNGTLVVSVPSAAGTTTTGFWLDECIITNPV